MSLRNAKRNLPAAWALVLLFGCGIQEAKQVDYNPTATAQIQNNDPPAAGGAPAMETGESPSEMAARMKGGPEGADQPAPSASVTPPSTDRYLIRNANLTIEVKDARVAHNKLIEAVRAAGGYVSNLQETLDPLGARAISLQVRVPATLFDRSMQQLSALGKVMHKNVLAEDVTEEYVDTESTVRNLKQTEERLLTHLRRTGKLADTLLIEKELTRVRYEIERREGRLRFLSHRVQFSTIDVTLQEAPRTQTGLPPESFSTGKEAAGATRSLIVFLRGLWTMAIWIGIWAVVWVPALIVVAMAWRALKRRYPHHSPPPPSNFMPDEPVGPPSERTGAGR